MEGVFNNCNVSMAMYDQLKKKFSWKFTQCESLLNTVPMYIPYMEERCPYTEIWDYI